MWFAGKPGLSFADPSALTTWTAIPDTGIPPQHAFSIPVGSNKQMFLCFRISNP